MVITTWRSSVEQQNIFRQRYNEARQHTEQDRISLKIQPDHGPEIETYYTKYNYQILQ